MFHDQDGSRDDLWAEHRKRREEWREQRRARREAWREAWRARREERRAQWRAAWGNWGHQANWGCNAAAPKQEADAELKATVEQMRRTIDALTQRVQVLEKLAVDPEARLAAEIDKLRDPPGAAP